jgi:hypothetical protein
MVCGLPVALSAIESVPLAAPVAAGVNTTLITQLEPAPDVVSTRLAVHVVPVPTLKSLAFVPPNEATVEPIVTDELPVLVTVTVMAALAVLTVWLGKVSVAGRAVTVMVAAEVPEPVRATVCGLLPSLSVKVSVAVSVVVTEGSNVTPTVQELPEVIVPVQVLFVVAKSVAEATGVPATTKTLVMTTPAFVLFVSVTVCGELVTPTTPPVNVSDVGETVTVGIRFRFATKLALSAPEGYVA